MVTFSHAAARAVLALVGRDQEAVASALQRCASAEAVAGATPLGPGARRLRVGRVWLIFGRDPTTVLAMRLTAPAPIPEGGPMMDDADAARFVTTPGGEELAILTRASYQRLAAVAAEHAREREAARAEAAADEALAQAREKAWDEAGRPSVSAEVLRRVRAGDSYMRAFRAARRLTQAELAARTGLAQGYLSEIETARKSANEEVAARIAVALGMHPIFLSPAAPAAEEAMVA